jgi:hypothetical protein
MNDDRDNNHFSWACKSTLEDTEYGRRWYLVALLGKGAVIWSPGTSSDKMTSLFGVSTDTISRKGIH